MQPLSKLRNQINNQIQLIKSSQIDIIDKIILTRSLLENYAILHFLEADNSNQRVELFQCFGEFEWASHQIYTAYPPSKRVPAFQRFLIHVRHQYPFGYQKYGRLIKRRLCKRLRRLIKISPRPKAWQSQLNLINSDKTHLLPVQLKLIAKYMSHHVITKLPFPYRVVFGKSITYFVLKYAPIDRNTYWLLADLSHGTLMASKLDPQPLTRIIKKIVNPRLTKK